jgi:predicted Zn-dependent protease
MGGVAIQSREALAPDEEFKIEFTLPNGFEFKADARVVWTGKLGRAALRFTGMQNSARDGLQDWIDTQIQKSQEGHKTKGTPSHELAIATPA